MSNRRPLVNVSGRYQELPAGDKIPYDSLNVFVDHGNSGTTTQTLDYLAGNFHKITVTGAFALSLSNWPASGTPAELVIQLVNGASSAVTWPTINWVKPDGTTTTSLSSAGIVLQSSGTDWIYLWSTGGISAIYGTAMR